MIQFICLISLTSIALVSCSVTSPKSCFLRSNHSLQWQQHKQNVSNLKQYKIYGSFTYLSNKQKIYIRFFWKQINHDCYNILLLTPFGNTKLELNTEGNFVQLIDNTGHKYIGNNIEEMINNFIGISIPFNNLRQWILGLPGKDTIYKLNDQCLLNEIYYTQSNKTWQIIYNDYDNRIQPTMPIKIELIKGNQHIRLNINKWIIE